MPLPWYEDRAASPSLTLRFGHRCGARSALGFNGEVHPVTLLQSLKVRNKDDRSDRTPALCSVLGTQKSPGARSTRINFSYNVLLVLEHNAVRIRNAYVYWFLHKVNWLTNRSYAVCGEFNVGAVTHAFRFQSRKTNARIKVIVRVSWRPQAVTWNSLRLR